MSIQAGRLLQQRLTVIKNSLLSGMSALAYGVCHTRSFVSIKRNIFVVRIFGIILVRSTTGNWEYVDSKLSSFVTMVSAIYWFILFSKTRISTLNCVLTISYAYNRMSLLIHFSMLPASAFRVWNSLLELDLQKTQEVVAFAKIDMKINIIQELSFRPRDVDKDNFLRIARRLAIILSYIKQIYFYICAAVCICQKVGELIALYSTAYVAFLDSNLYSFLTASQCFEWQHGWLV
jgi:hypothetical protein